MNLLEATATLIDAAKTYAPEQDKVIQRAVRRMEKRYLVLQVRAAKARKRNRINSFWHAMAIFNGGAAQNPDHPRRRKEACIPCQRCGHLIFFSEFCKGATFSGAGRIQFLECGACGLVMESLVEAPAAGATRQRDEANRRRS